MTSLKTMTSSKNLMASIEEPFDVMNSMASEDCFMKSIEYSMTSSDYFMSSVELEEVSRELDEVTREI